MERVITIQPVTRIEGHARIAIHLNEEGEVADTRVHVMGMRGFEKFIEGRPAEEVPKIVNRICGICPWMHHLAANKAVDGCFGATPPPAGSKLRELVQSLAYMSDKILHFFFLAAPDFVLGPDSDYSIRNVIGIAQQAPDLARQVVQMRYRAQMMIERFAGKVIHPIAAVPGGFSKPLTERDRQDLLTESRALLEFAKYAMELAKTEIFPKYEWEVENLGTIRTGFLGTVRPDGSFAIYDGNLRLMKSDGAYQDFTYLEYTHYLGEHVEPWSYVKFPYARAWQEGFSMAPEAPKGIYRANTLARLNVADFFHTPLAQAELEEFRSKFGRPAQSTLLYHWARLIELLFVCERALELLDDPEITDPEVRTEVIPRAGRGVGCVEAPRGTLIHDYSTDEKGCITRANMIVGTTHNMAPINLSARQAADLLIKKGQIDQGILNRVEMAVRAYDP